MFKMKPIVVTDSATKRFRNKVNIANADECWEWNGTTNKKGYGMFSVGSRCVFAHRYSYVLAHGEIPEGLLICHKCDNPKCVNPAHLFAGTNKENIIDAFKKKRMSWNPVDRPGMQSDLVSGAEAARILGIGKYRIPRLISSGKLETVNAPNRRLITRESVESLRL